MIKFLYIEIMGKRRNLILTDATHRILDTIKHISPLVNRYRSLYNQVLVIFYLLRKKNNSS